MCICPPHLLGMRVHSCSSCVCTCARVCLSVLPFWRPIHSCLWSFFCMSLMTWLLCLRASASLMLDMKWASITELDGQWSRSQSGKFWHVDDRFYCLFVVVDVKNVYVILYVNNNYNIYLQISWNRCRGKSFLWSRICVYLKMKVQNKAHTHTMKISKNKTDKK